MESNIVKNWFGNRFNDLHPLLQQLHIRGGQLRGDVNITYGKGLAGVIGRRLAKKMNLPSMGTQQLTVTISHDERGLRWSRQFNQSDTVTSLFIPVGTIEQGYWIEKTGPVSMKLTVDIRNGGWFWRCLEVKAGRLSLPLWLIPGSTAYKVIENDRYRFHVEFSLPVLGTLICYQGLLQAD
ncbi:DUF4166 domain-containing protein [Kangiella shandongensis]|uniref:DUF4166 domain-containing protein n=1 Tax=Kangiella shandongensis TaxID=2763258 RepID=UPI001CBA9BF1|nr:DUF4166 domain-containing protein [Kangiella shandongensis]